MDKDITIHFDSLDKVHQVLTIPFNDYATNKKLIASIIHSNKSITFDEALLYLNEYLLDLSVTVDEYKMAYNASISNINKLIDDISNRTSYEDGVYYNYVPYNEFIEKYKWPKNIYIYDPFKTYENMSISKSIKENYKQFMNLWTNIINFNYDLRCSFLVELAQQIYRDTIIYSENNTSEYDIIKNLENLKYEYYAIRFIYIAIRQANAKNYHTYIYADKCVYIMDRLLSKNVINNYNKLDDVSISVTKSISWDSYDTEDFKTEANKEANLEIRKQLLDSIHSKNENEIDIFSGEKWEDMSLYKLKHVISIPTVINREGKTSKILYHAFYVRTLYQAWRYAVKDNVSFTNPYNRALITEQDKKNILDAMVKLFPSIKAPVNQGRNDIRFTTIKIDEINNLYFDYIIKRPKHDDISIRILHIQISISDEFDVAQLTLIDNIEKLLRKNKIFGRKIPLKIMDIFKNYHNLNRPLNLDEFRQFYNAIM